MLLKVIQKRTGLFTDWAEVDCLSTSGQKEKLVEFLKEYGARLVNGAKYGLTVLGETTKEGNDGPRAL
jgi:hypothetical protein